MKSWLTDREKEREREREEEEVSPRCEQRDRVSRSQFNQHPVQLLVNYEWQLRHRDEHLFVLSSHCRACSKDPFDTVVCARHDRAGEIAHVARTWHREWIFIRSLSDSSRQNYASSREKRLEQGGRERGERDASRRSLVAPLKRRRDVFTSFEYSFTRCSICQERRNFKFAKIPSFRSLRLFSFS